VYDALNRLTQKNEPGAISAEYTYDLVDKILQVNDPTGTYALAYDISLRSLEGNMARLNRGPPSAPLISVQLRSNSGAR